MSKNDLPTSNLGIIVSQAPNDFSLSQYYAMLYQHNVNVVLEILNEADYNKIVAATSIHDPNLTSPVKPSLIGRSLLQDYLTKDDVDLDKERGATNRVTIFRMKEYSFDSVDDIDHVLQTISYIRKEFRPRLEESTFVLQDEHGGTSRAAIITALIHLLEEVDDQLISNVREHEKYIDVFKVVDMLRSKRMNMISSYEEYDFIHRAISYYKTNKTKYDQLLDLKNSIKTGTKEEDVSCPPNKQEKSIVEYLIPQTDEKWTETEDEAAYTDFDGSDDESNDINMATSNQKQLQSSDNPVDDIKEHLVPVEEGAENGKEADKRWTEAEDEPAYEMDPLELDECDELP